jgi:hypothetical protein
MPVTVVKTLIALLAMCVLFSGSVVPCVRRKTAVAKLTAVRRREDEPQLRDNLRCETERLVAKDPMSPHVGGRTLRRLKVKPRDYRAGERGCDPREHIVVHCGGFLVCMLGPAHMNRLAFIVTLAALRCRLPGYFGRLVLGNCSNSSAMRSSTASKWSRSS